MSDKSAWGVVFQAQIEDAQARLDKLPPGYREALGVQVDSLNGRTTLNVRQKRPNLSTPEGQVRDCGGW